LFRRFPYYPFLLLGLLAWVSVIIYTHQRKQALKPSAIAAAIAEDIEYRDRILAGLLEDQSLIRRMYSGDLTHQEIRALEEQPFQIYAFEQDVLIFWNNNTVIGTCSIDSLRSEHNSLFSSNGVYLRKCFSLPFLEPNKTIVALFPIVHRYPFENQYLRSHFAAGDHIPVTTVVSDSPAAKSQKVLTPDGKTIFYLQFPETTATDLTADNTTIYAVLAGLLFSFIWANLIAVRLSRTRSKRLALLWLLLCIFLFRGYSYLSGYPFGLSELPLFSPALYASSGFLPSLADLILNLVCLLWLLVMMLHFYPGFRILKERSGMLPKAGMLLLSTGLILSCSLLPVTLVRSLVRDSGISFDVSHFYTVTPYTIAGLLAITLLAICLSMLIFLLHAQLRYLFANIFQRYLFIVVAVTCGVFIIHDAFTPDRAAGILWLVFFLVLLDLPFISKPQRLFAPGMIFWAAFVAGCCTFGLLYYYEIKEENYRKQFAEQIANQRDNVIEYLFEDIGQKISADQWLNYFLDSPSVETRSIIDERLSSTYLSGPLNRYEARIYLFGKGGSPLYNGDTTSMQRLRQVQTAAIPTNSFLYYRENAIDRHYYLAAIPVRSDSAKIAGYVFIDLSLKDAGNQSVYPELLQPGAARVMSPRPEYMYGLYMNNQLMAQAGDFPFPVYLPNRPVNRTDFLLQDPGENEVYTYPLSRNRVIVIIQPHNELMEVITLFSYLLGMFLVFALLVLLFRLLFLWLVRRSSVERIIHLTLRRRIQFAMLGLVLLSFLIIGAVTIWFFVAQYEQSNRTKLQTAMQTAERAMQQFVKAHRLPADPNAFARLTDSTAFRYFINGLAAEHEIDINVYDYVGNLKATSQEDIYNKFILARIMMPDAYYLLSQEGSTALLQDESIGRLEYLSSYIPLRAAGGQTLGYINIPLFSSEKELNYQISNVVVALINLYAFIFLLSSLLTVFITDWLTRTLQIIISKFEHFNLHRNELLEWPYEDEIGLLIREYNKMVRKVEENAQLLAKSERESAWREMARQVAHEIKNPLTPMKLNIQYLQQALKNNHPNARQLTEHVAESMIEQIDNLSHIASAFSDFAKMPEAQPEELELNELLEKSTELYLNDTNTEVRFQPTGVPAVVYMDRSQLLRVLNNLIQNATQAIPEDREGLVQVRLEQKEDTVLIVVADNGSGIPEEVRERIFSPYFTTKGSGTGLGLAMTKKIIEFWNGRIWFETKENEGTGFFIELPLVRPAASL